MLIRDVTRKRVGVFYAPSCDYRAADAPWQAGAACSGFLLGPYLQALAVP